MSSNRLEKLLHPVGDLFELKLINVCQKQCTLKNQITATCFGSYRTTFRLYTNVETKNVKL